MAVVMKIANQGHINTHAIQLLANVRHLGCCFRCIDRDAHHFRASIGQFFDLYRRANGIYRIGIGHGLHPNGRITTNSHCARTPNHRGLARALNCWARTGNRLNDWQTRLHHFTSKNATLFFAIEVKSLT